ncbi:hypothetical protein AB1Y20_016013 [Prymnesium parvum]|uniref:Mic1 domain-containing protein n=1 Tax=Prymnesium parvum TaxID=97485 RepID=A0AB34JYT1_PRYPA
MHVTISSILEFDEEDSQLRFDEASRRLVLIKHREFTASSVDGHPPIRYPVGGKVENVRFSLNHRLAALQRSESQLEIVDLLLGHSFLHTCKACAARPRARILSFHWTGKAVADFVVVTSAGAEFFLVSPERSALKLVKRVAVPAAWCVYSHESHLLLLASGAQDNVLHGLQVQPHAIVRVPKFEVALAPLHAPAAAGQQRPRRSLQPCHVHVLRLYHMILCAHLAVEEQQLYLYQLFKDFVVRKYALPIYSSHAALSVVDNLLVVHALDAKVALIFDLKINCQYPVTAPLPVSLVDADGFGPLYSSHWQLFPPDLLVDPQAGRVGRVAVDLRAVAASSVDVACLLQFLLARANAADVIVELFHQAVAERMPLAHLSKLFQLLHAAIAAANPPPSPSPSPFPSSASAPIPVTAAVTAAALRASPSSAPLLALPEPAAPPAEEPCSPTDDSMREELGLGREHADSLSTRCSSEASNSRRASEALSLQCATEALAVALGEASCADPPAGEEEAASPPAADGAGGCEGAAGDGGEGGDAAEGEAPAGEEAESSTAPVAAEAAAPVAAASVAAAAARLQSSTSLDKALALLPDSGPPMVSLSASAQLVRAVFLPAVEKLSHPADVRDPARRYLIGALTALLHSLLRHAHMADEEAGSLLISLLAEQGSYFQVHQFVQYNAVPDSPRLVVQLFDMAPRYPPAAALAVDLLRRLGPPAHETIIDWMLHRGQLLTTCRFIRQQGMLTFPAKPLLDAAAACDNPQVFTAVYGFLLRRNEVWRGHADFLPEDDCAVHTERWERECQGTY